MHLNIYLCYFSFNLFTLIYFYCIAENRKNYILFRKKHGQYPSQPHEAKTIISSNRACIEPPPKSKYRSLQRPLRQNKPQMPQRKWKIIISVRITSLWGLNNSIRKIGVAGRGRGIVRAFWRQRYIGNKNQMELVHQNETKKLSLRVYRHHWNWQGWLWNGFQSQSKIYWSHQGC